jgi:CheY-like chemotaxis protein
LDEPVGSILVDPAALEQVVVNLGVNARDAMPNGGRLVLETDVVSVDEGYSAVKGTRIPPGDYVRVSLSDNGVGIDEKTQQFIFEPFFTTKEHGKGTGLGLSTVYGIVRQAGGYIWVYSEVGEGTTFRIYFPRVEAPALELPRAPVVRALGGTETILVVEDDHQIRSLCKRVLVRMGYEVLVASDGSEALAICGQRGGLIHLVLTDIVMPTMSGKQLAKHLSRTRPDAKILFMSGYTPNAIVHDGVVDPGVALLQKPFSPEGIAKKVREVLDADEFYARSFAAEGE